MLDSQQAYSEVKAFLVVHLGIELGLLIMASHWGSIPPRFSTTTPQSSGYRPHSVGKSCFTPRHEILQTFCLTGITLENNPVFCVWPSFSRATNLSHVQTILAVSLYLLPDLLTEENPEAHEASQRSLQMPASCCHYYSINYFQRSVSQVWIPLPLHGQRTVVML